MTERFIAFDVETPNHENSRMSALGITVIDDREITQKLYFTINPGTYFDLFNIELTGITPESVADSPNFAAVWEQTEHIFRSGILVAHNAPFDMSVLSKCLRDYRIPQIRCLEYACTCRMARRFYPELQNHKLDTLCRHLGISLLHHNAMSDSVACAEIFLDCISKGADPYDFVKNYDVLLCKTFKK